MVIKEVKYLYILTKFLLEMKSIYHT